ncbi:MAG: metallophosphoesterase [Eubacteriales bacterium]|nr:metallophosphoesterase [Eubacteriales bacterium]
MSIFALADLHMDGKQGKPMAVFGEKWNNHCERIFENWSNTVSREDLVLIPGDICWAMQLNDAIDDINKLSALPGTKLLLRGNHDYWWSSLAKMQSMFPEDVHIIQNDSFVYGDTAIAGTRGWLYPAAAGYTEKDEKIYNRELIRLELTLSSAMRRIKDNEANSIILMLHYPPLGTDGAATGFTELIDKYPVTDVVYGHLHAQSAKFAFEGERSGKMYHLCSSDHLDFYPKLIKKDN